jgi:hypothetical protein
LVFVIVLSIIFDMLKLLYIIGFWDERNIIIENKVNIILWGSVIDRILVLVFKEYRILFKLLVFLGIL